MKVLSLLQPWATLVVIGAKKIETRSWAAEYKGPILIHASAGKYIGSGRNKISCRELCYQEPFKAFINGAAYDNLPFGTIIGKTELVWCANTEDLRSRGQFTVNQNTWNLTEQEKSFGDYSDGRYGWLLKDAVEFENPVRAKGSLILWEHPDIREEEIICPQCDTRQWATVELTIPFASYVHHCRHCKYTIMESEWNKAEEEK